MLAQEIVATLGMQRHPEGGWYVETFRDNPASGPHGPRGNQTAIYFLLEHGDVSHIPTARYWTPAGRTG